MAELLHYLGKRTMGLIITVTIVSILKGLYNPNSQVCKYSSLDNKYESYHFNVLSD